MDFSAKLESMFNKGKPKPEEVLPEEDAELKRRRRLLAMANPMAAQQEAVEIEKTPAKSSEEQGAAAVSDVLQTLGQEPPSGRQIKKLKIRRLGNV